MSLAASPAMDGGGIGGHIAGAGVKLSGLLLNWVAPIGAFLAGLQIKDIFGIYGILNGLIPEAFTKNQFVNIVNLLTALVYFAIAFLALRFVPMVGRAIAGLMGGCGLGVLFQGLKGAAGALKPPVTA